MSEENKNNDTQRDERNKKRQERNLKLVENPDAIVIIPFAKPNRYALTWMVIQVDKVVSKLKRQIGFDMEFDTAQTMLNKLDSFNDSLWEQVIKVAPSLYSKRKEDWRQLNDPVDQRRIMAHRVMATVITPRSDEAGQAAMAVKIIENANFNARTSDVSFEQLKEMTEDYRALVEGFDTFLTTISKEAGVEYRNLNKSKEETAAETVNIADAKKKKTDT